MKTTITRIAMLIGLMLVGGVAQAQTYALHYRSTNTDAIEPGSTFTYDVEDWEIENGMAAISFIIENLTDETLMTTQEVVMIEGPEAMAHPEICGGGSCPWSGNPYPCTPGPNPSLPVVFDIFTAGLEGMSALYQVTIMNAENTEQSVSIYLRVNVGVNGIEDATADQPKAYPNPTMGKVTIGDKCYDLSTRPAGLYLLPYQGSNVKVIKL